MNSILVIHPYKYEGIWVFDDPAAGLVKEAFVAGADVILDKITAHRRKVFTRILRRVDPADSAALAQSLGLFVEAAHEYDPDRSLVP